MVGVFFVGGPYLQVCCLNVFFTKPAVSNRSDIFSYF